MFLWSIVNIRLFLRNLCHRSLLHIQYMMQVWHQLCQLLQYPQYLCRRCCNLGGTLWQHHYQDSSRNPGELLGIHYSHNSDLPYRIDELLHYKYCLLYWTTQ